MNVTAAESVDEQAAAWCMRLAEKGLTAEERRAFDAWIADPAHHHALEEAMVVWQGLEQAADSAELIRMRSAALESLREANSQRWAKRTQARWRRPIAVAAAIVIALIGTMLVVRGGARIYETDIGERRVVSLADGSQISLDAATRVEARLAQDRRSLRLVSGRARFNVAKDPLRPFSVSAGNKVVVATGTSFSVELVQGQVRVVLYEGHVEVLQPANDDGPGQSASPGSKAVPAARELVPGRELLASAIHPDAVVMPADVSRSLSWESGQLNFVDEPIGLAVERMNRYSTQQLVVGDSRAATLIVNGVFDAGDTAAFIEAVKAFSPIRVEETEGRLVLMSEPASTQ